MIIGKPEWSQLEKLLVRFLYIRIVILKSLDCYLDHHANISLDINSASIRLSLNCPLIFHLLLQNYSIKLNVNGNAQHSLSNDGNWHIEVYSSSVYHPVLLSALTG